VSSGRLTTGSIFKDERRDELLNCFGCGGSLRRDRWANLWASQNPRVEASGRESGVFVWRKAQLQRIEAHLRRGSKKGLRVVVEFEPSRIRGIDECGWR